jgi:hypothetical protein
MVLIKDKKHGPGGPRYTQMIKPIWVKRIRKTLILYSNLIVPRNDMFLGLVFPLLPDVLTAVKDKGVRGLKGLAFQPSPPY